MHPMLNTAVKAARRAGVTINRASLDIDRVSVAQKAPQDFVTDIDRQAEAEIIEVLRTAYPEHGILAEESGEIPAAEYDDQGRAAFQWIIDPIDGTTNFVHGYPQYAISIALAQFGRITQAVVYDPSRNELFTATRGSGAYLNDRRIRVTRRTRLHECLIGMGYAATSGRRHAQLIKVFGQLSVSAAGARRAGSSVLDLAWVAAGRLDGYIGDGMKPWDVAAGALLILEAGGLVGDYEGNDDWLNAGQIVVATPKIFPPILALAQPLKQVAASAAASEAGDSSDSGLDAAPF